MKVCDLTGQTLDLLVARADGVFGKLVTWRDLHNPPERVLWNDASDAPLPIYRPSIDWSVAGPIIEHERIDLSACDPGPDWLAWCSDKTGFRCEASGPTPLVVAMRCYVVSKFGEEVPDAEKVGDVPWVSTTDAFTKPPFVKPRIMGEIVAEVFNRAFEKDEKDKKP